MAARGDANLFQAPSVTGSALTHIVAPASAFGAAVVGQMDAKVQGAAAFAAAVIDPKHFNLGYGIYLGPWAIP